MSCLEGVALCARTTDANRVKSAPQEVNRGLFHAPSLQSNKLGVLGSPSGISFPPLMGLFGTDHLDKSREKTPPECQMPVSFLCADRHPLPLCLLLFPDQGENNHTTKTQVSVSKFRCSLSPSFLWLPEARSFLALASGKVLADAQHLFLQSPRAWCDKDKHKTL